MIFMNPDSPIEATSDPMDDSTPQREPQLLGHLARLAAGADAAQELLDRLLENAQHSGDQIDVLTRHLTDPATARPGDERLAEFASRLEEVQGQLEEVAGAVTK